MEDLLDNSVDTLFGEVNLGETDIDISGKVCRVSIVRNVNGNIEIIPIDEGIWEQDGWLSEGSCTTGLDDEVIISRFVSNE